MRIWQAVDQIVDQATDSAGLQAHGLHLWAARRWQMTGRSVPPGFLEHERAATMAVLSVPSLLTWVRSVLDDPIVLLKGPEVAARYPDPVLRPFGDLDLLVPQPDDAQCALLKAGCVEVIETGPDHHHRPALQCPGSPLFIEIHDRPSWPRWTEAQIDDIFAAAVPSALGVDGILTLPPAHQAVLLAAHSWHHEPLRRLIDLVDIAAITEDLDPVMLEEMADGWALGPVWHITNRAIDALCTGVPPQRWSERLLGHHLWTARERTIIEWRFARWTAGFWAPTLSVAIRSILWSLVQDVRPNAEETWSRRLARIPGALGRSLRPISERQKKG